ncbi:hypothetical protein A2U01_0103387, partial [Trifolium medium]|nr:hypothetical protein [Trifolium medium]
SSALFHEDCILFRPVQGFKLRSASAIAAAILLMR